VNQIPAKTRALTPKQEAFARAVLTEDSYSDAYRKAYAPKKMSDVAINKEASKLMARPDIAGRVAELRQVVADAAVMKKREWIEMLTNMARADVRRMFDNHGNPKEITDLDAAEANIVAGFEVVENFAGKGEEKVLAGYTRKYRLTQKLDVLKELGEALGFYPDPKRKEIPLGADGQPVQQVIKIMVVNAPAQPGNAASPPPPAVSVGALPAGVKVIGTHAR
jgi:phage terminase small subunit